MIDFKELNSRLAADARGFVPSLIPGGKTRGHEYVAASIAGGDGDSFSVNLLTGRFADFANPEIKGGDFIALYAAVHGLSQIDAAKELGAEDRPKLNGYAHSPPEESAVHFERPPHVEFRAELFRHRQFGTPSTFWVYRDAEGPRFVVARYDQEGQRKQICPWVWTGNSWISKGPPKPRPLYGLHRLSNPTRALVVEGEKTCDAAQHYFPSRPCLTWMGGVSGWKQTDWEPLRGREVTLWPDADDPGRGCMASIAAKLMGMGCKVWVVETDVLPDKWDLADALSEGWDVARVLAYAKPHTKPVEPPESDPLPTPAVVERVQRTPAPGTQTYEEATPQNHGSLQTLWQAKFQCKPSGNPYNNMTNVVRGIELIGDIDLWYDAFARRIMLGKEEWTDNHNLELLKRLQLQFGLGDLRNTTVREGVQHYAFSRQRNPPKEWLESLEWDREERLWCLLSKGLGAAQDDYSAAVGRCFMVGMVARVMNPGCKVDCMPIFEGSQGLGKSTALKIIGGPYFAEIHESITSKDFYLAIAGKMLCEISELHAFRRAEIERIKGIITTATDRFRIPFGTFAADHPRSCVFAGTTNLDDWNTDETGARRFWPVRCFDIDRDWLSEHRHQLFAEAVHRYRAGESWWDVPETEQKAQADERRDLDPWETLIDGYLRGKDVVYIPHIIDNVLELKPKDMNAMTQKRVAKVLRTRGFENRVARLQNGDVERRWVREGKPAEKD